jgi:hypothetical protein
MIFQESSRLQLVLLPLQKNGLSVLLDISQYHPTCQIQASLRPTTNLGLTPYDKSDVLKIDTFDKLDELLRTAEKHYLATLRTVHFVYKVDDNDTDIDRLELCTARFLGALPHLQTLQLDGCNATGWLLQRAITEASATSFGELKTVISDLGQL